MEFFHQPNLHWMSKAKYFFALSGILLACGIAAWVHHGGLHYGIDFKGGTQVKVRFAEAVPTDAIRKGLADQGLGDSTIQPLTDVTSPNFHDVVIGLELKGESQEALDAGKTAILNALHHTLEPNQGDKQDFNAASPSAISDYLIRRDPLGLGPTAGDRYVQMGRRITDFRDKDSNGIIKDFSELKRVEGVNDAVVATLRDGFYPGSFTVGEAEIVGPKVGAELRRQAVWVTLSALGGMLVYIAFRFEWVYGVAAVVAVFHDVLITLGLFSIFYNQFEISLTVIAALLTLVGYSMNDTIVIFDRVRENNRLMRRERFEDIVNRSINQTLSRTILTSGLTFLTCLVLFLLGGQVLRSFSFALVVGVLVGTYSSFGIAAPLVVAYNQWRGGEKVTTGAGAAAGNKPRRDEARASRPVAAGGR